MASISTIMISATLLVASSTVAMAGHLSTPAATVDVRCESGDHRSRLWSPLLEPGHVAYSRSPFLFVGPCVGAAPLTGVGAGFAFSPRATASFKADRSRPRTYRYTTDSRPSRSRAESDPDVTVGSVVAGLLFNVGYVAMW
jgi:hypothetical protein